MSDQHYWESKARIYDRITAPLARPMKSAALLAADAVRGENRVLEVAAGTGLFTTAIAGAAREVVATDYATAMVAILAKRVQEAGFQNVRCEQADIKALRFDRASFDCVVAANVLHLMPDLAATLAALRRVLRPDGNSLCQRSVTTKPDWLPSCRDYFRLRAFPSSIASPPARCARP
jgi:phosphatidylethanolamine/phosphatidyl-N-methylethanolamine N-methyltransferase